MAYDVDRDIADAPAQTDILALGEAMIEFNQAHGDVEVCRRISRGEFLPDEQAIA